MKFDSKEQKAIVLEALGEYHGKGCGSANHVKLTLSQASQILQHLQTVSEGEVEDPKPEKAKKEFK